MGGPRSTTNGGHLLDTKKNLISDYECTNFPEGNWHACCVQHDYDYAEGVNKWKADAKLAWCIVKKKRPLVALVVWIGVTIGGWEPYNEHKEAREYARSIGR